MNPAAVRSAAGRLRDQGARTWWAPWLFPGHTPAGTNVSAQSGRVTARARLWSQVRRDASAEKPHPRGAHAWWAPWLYPDRTPAGTAALKGVMTLAETAQSTSATLQLLHALADPRRCICRWIYERTGPIAQPYLGCSPNPASGVQGGSPYGSWILDLSMQAAACWRSCSG